MPIYEFRCERCGERFEALRRLGDQGDGLECPACGAGSPEKLPSTFAASTGSTAASTSRDQGSRSCGSGGFA